MNMNEVHVVKFVGLRRQKCLENKCQCPICLRDFRFTVFLTANQTRPDIEKSHCLNLIVLQPLINYVAQLELLDYQI